jgi:hypothetical protein
MVDWVCPYLKEDNTCKVYAMRDKLKPLWCHTIDELKALNRIQNLPKNCIYQGG